MTLPCGTVAIMSDVAVLDHLHAVGGSHAALQLLIVHGSRARGEAHARSDWDVGYLADNGLDHFGLLADLASQLGTDAVDLVDLSATSALLRFRAARDGRAVYEREPGSFQEFAVAASLFWCDIEPVVRRAHHAVLAELG